MLSNPASIDPGLIFNSLVVSRNGILPIIIIPKKYIAIVKKYVTKQRLDERSLINYLPNPDVFRLLHAVMWHCVK